MKTQATKTETFTVAAERLNDEELGQVARKFVYDAQDVYIDDPGVWPTFAEYLAFRIGRDSMRYVYVDLTQYATTKEWLSGGRKELERFILAVMKAAKDLE
jgi:hypothetical protein